MRLDAARWQALIVVSFLGLAPVRVPAKSLDDPWELRFRQVTPTIDVAFRPEPLRLLVEGNVTIIYNESDVVVVDGSGAPRAARQVIAHIQERTRNPVRLLVNTHGHGDHTLGNQKLPAPFRGWRSSRGPKHGST